MKKRHQPNVLLILAIIFAAGVIFSSVGGAGSDSPYPQVAAYQAY